jgi:hypothetical protein
VRVLLYDKTDKLTPFWAMGRILSRWDAVIPATSWDDATEKLWDVPEPVTHLQFWGHGTAGSPVINGSKLGLALQLRNFANAARFTEDSVVWWRACNVFHGEEGHRFARQFAAVAGCSHVGHTRVVSAPWPIYQSGGHGLRLGKEPHWSKTEGDGRRGGSGPRMPNTCLVTRMTVPESWWTT